MIAHRTTPGLGKNSVGFTTGYVQIPRAQRCSSLPSLRALPDTGVRLSNTTGTSKARRAIAIDLPVSVATAAATLLSAVGPAAAAVAGEAVANPIADLAVAAAEFDPSLAHAIEVVLRPAFSIGTLLYLVRVPMSWYPQIDTKQLPWSIAAAPTEPFLSATRKVIPLVGGVDVTPLIWVGLLSFFSEILLGPQGLLMLAQRV